MSEGGTHTDARLVLARLPRGRGEWVVSWLLAGTAASVVSVFLCILASLLHRGMSGLTLDFLLGVVRDAGRSGGIGPIIVSTLWILGVCLLAALPVGLGTAILLAEFSASDGMLGKVVRISLDVLAGVPSIVFALFGNAFFCIYLGFGFSILAGGMTLACMVLPFWIRAAELSLRAVPNDYRLAAAALGMSRHRLITRILLPTAAPGLLAGLVLVVGRALSETAPLLLTSGYVTRMPGSVYDSGRSLAVHIYDLSMNVPGGEANAASASLVLVVLLVVLNSGMTWLSERFLHGRVLQV